MLQDLQVLMDINTLLFGQEVRTEHPVYQLVQPVHFADDDARVLAERFLLLQQLGGTTQTAQGVFDLVGQTPEQCLRRLVLREQVLFADNTQMMVLPAELDEGLG